MNLSVLRGGFSTKIHLLTDRQGLPLGAVLSGGQRHESAFFVDLMEEVSVPRPRGRPRKRPEAAQGRSGLRCRLDPALALRQRHRVGDPGPQRPPRGPWTPTNLRRPEVPRPKHGRALCWPSQGAAASRGPIRKEGEPLQGDDPLGIRRGVPESIIIRRSLVGVRQPKGHAELGL
jgi:hypothetical protein